VYTSVSVVTPAPNHHFSGGILQLNSRTLTSVILIFSRSMPSSGWLRAAFTADGFSGAGEVQPVIPASESTPDVAAAELKNFLRDKSYMLVTSRLNS
jgi:hypothetical protein